MSGSAPLAMKTPQPARVAIFAAEILLTMPADGRLARGAAGHGLDLRGDPLDDRHDLPGALAGRSAPGPWKG